MKILFIFGVPTIAWIFPATTQKGRIELLHSKPMSRTGIFFSMFGSSLVGFSICIALLLASITFIFAIRFYLYLYGALFAIFISIFTVFIVLTYFFLFAVLTNNSLLSLTLTWVYTIILPIFLQARNKVLYPLFENELIHKFIEILYYIVPQTSDLLSNIKNSFFSEAVSITPFIYSSIFAVVALLFTIHIFKNKDF